MASCAARRLSLPVKPTYPEAVTTTRPLRASYLALARSGELSARARQLEARLADCTLCPRECRVDRRRELGSCATGAAPVIASWGPHFGEERPISGIGGSGTVFLANCNLACVYCQNWDISQRPQAFRHRTLDVESLAAVFLELQDRGCHNLNWVSPTHQAPQLVAALEIAAARGLELPVVYNSNGYDSVEVLRLLDGVVDVYMPDLKYANATSGRELSGISDYPDRAREAIAEMYRQVGSRWAVGPAGELRRGLLVRLLVLPGDRAGVDHTLCWIGRELSPDVVVSLLAQYRPAHRAQLGRWPELARRLRGDEWQAALDALERHLPGDRHLVQGAPQ